jgi:hypothetical protein
MSIRGQTIGNKTSQMLCSVVQCAHAAMQPVHTLAGMQVRAPQHAYKESAQSAQREHYLSIIGVPIWWVQVRLPLGQ